MGTSAIERFWGHKEQAALRLRRYGNRNVGLGASALAMWVFNDALAELGPERSSAFQYLQPFVTVVGSLALLGEPVTTGPLLGGPLVLLGVWLVQRGKR